MTARPLAVTVSGSFQRHFGAVQAAVAELTACGALVLSPADPRIVDSLGGFVFVASDIRRTVKGVQNRHLAAIARSAFLWFVCPDGYIGPSGALEIGFAAAHGVPVYSVDPPSDITLMEYVDLVATPAQACALARAAAPAADGPGVVLLDPDTTIATIHDELDVLDRQLHDPTERHDDPAEATIARVTSHLRLPVRS